MVCLTGESSNEIMEYAVLLLTEGAEFFYEAMVRIRLHKIKQLHTIELSYWFPSNRPSSAS
ncbi:Male salivary gland protein 7, partial [Frankliniella occidentalis]